MDLADLRNDVPALAAETYLNWGASGPSPTRTVDAIEETLERFEYDAPTAEGMYPAAVAVFEETRETVAEFVGADDAEIALTQSTTDAINRVATAIDWRPGDEVVITDIEHAAGRLPWYRLARDVGIEVTELETHRGEINPEEFAAAVEGARLACFSAVDWLYGRRHPVETLVDVAHDADVLTLVDAVQVPGHLSMDVDAWGADLVAAAGHKWLLGPWGAGFLYVDADVADDLRPGAVGYRGVEDPNAEAVTYRPGARRFEVGTTNPAPYAGLQAAIETVQQVGQERITGTIMELTARLKAEIPDERLRSPEPFHSGLVSIEADDPAATVERLSAAGVHIRSLPVPETVRVSVHAVNTAADVDAFLDVF
ncbi:MAG: aminotransferase class V-fold PLP-dependent enzyme [Halanaeroarchaeum sp.]